jgi:hypothetical protein
MMGEETDSAPIRGIFFHFTLNMYDFPPSTLQSIFLPCLSGTLWFPSDKLEQIGLSSMALTVFYKVSVLHHTCTQPTNSQLAPRLSPPPSSSRAPNTSSAARTWPAEWCFSLDSTPISLIFMHVLFSIPLLATTDEFTKVWDCYAMREGDGIQENGRLSVKAAACSPAIVLMLCFC